MPFDLDRAAAFLASPTWDGPWPAGAPARDFARSPAAARVGRLALDDGLFLFHFEHRTTLELPEPWIAPGQTAELPEWTDGVLPESKYQSFRHDLYLGSFHPGHRAKWTTHELCHGLVGTAWRPDAAPLFHATAARLAELLPVVLWYFLDEIGLRRCPDHAGDGALFRTFCPACEEVAVAAGPVEDPERWLVGARTFLDRELAAVRRSVRLGRPVPHRWATIDLASDGVAYAAAHGRRLDSPAFRRLAETFDVGFRSLDALEARVVETARAICEGAPLSPGPGRYVAQDLAWRLLQIAEDTDGEVRAALDGLVDELAAGRLTEVLAAYRELHEDVYLPDPEVVFAVGYELAGIGRSVAQVREGLRTVTPLVLELAEDAGVPLVEAFVGEDAPVRRPLGDRFADWLGSRHAVAGELARYESALRHAGGDSVAGVLGSDAVGPWKLAAGARALVFERDVTALAEQVDAGAIQGRSEGGALALEGPVPSEQATGVVIGRDGAGEVLVVEVPAAAAAALARGEEPVLGEEERALLVEVGVLVPTAWRLTRT